MSNLFLSSLGDQILEMVQGEFLNYVYAFLLVAVLVMVAGKFLSTSEMHQTKKVTYIAVFAALAFVFMFVGFPIIPSAPYLKVEFSVLVLLILALKVDYKAAIIASLIVNLLDFMFKQSLTGLPIDQGANFLATLAFIIPVLLLSKKFNRYLTVIIATLSVTVAMVALNFLFITPFYFNLLGWPLPENLFWYCLSLYGPFNLIKWGLVGISFIIVKKKLA